MKQRTYLATLPDRSTASEKFAGCQTDELIPIVFRKIGVRSMGIKSSPD
jgi:hypothetical protein